MIKHQSYIFVQSCDVLNIFYRRSIGVVKRRFHCLHDELRMTPEKACKVIYVCMYLHNLAVDFNDAIYKPLKIYEEGNYDYEDEDDDTDGDDDDDDDDRPENYVVTNTERASALAGKVARQRVIETFQ